MHFLSFLLIFSFSIPSDTKDNIQIDLGAYTCIYKNGRVELLSNDLPSSISTTSSSSSISTTSSSSSTSSSSISTMPTVSVTPSPVLVTDGGKVKYIPEDSFIVEVDQPSNLPFVGYLEDDDDEVPSVYLPQPQPEQDDDKMSEEVKVLSILLPPSGPDELFVSSHHAFAPLNSPADVGHDAFRPSPPLQHVKSGFAPINSQVDLGHDIFNIRVKRTTSDLEMCRKLIANYIKNINKPKPSKPTTHSKSPRKQIVPRPVLPSYAHFYPEKFCIELADGFYRHPRNFSRIIQCFGHQLFEYPPCLHGLVFNELRGVCDYPKNLSSSSYTSETSSCSGGHSHGEHIGHPEICSIFYRCVWGRLFSMSCPDGTAFNSKLSVCDYKENVPNCNK